MLKLTLALRARVEFATLDCVGWTDTSSAALPRIGLVFRCPLTRDGLASWPQSLRTRISASRSVGAPSPPLGDRFDLAWGVASAVANIISVGWSKWSDVLVLLYPITSMVPCFC